MSESTNTEERFPLITLSIDDFDADGALRETAGRLPTRSAFLSRGARAAAAGALALGLLPGSAQAGSAKGDVAILNFALALEYLQAAFYTEAQRVGALRGPLAEQARVVGSHERAHVKAIVAALGPSAIRSPRFNFHGVTESAHSFRATAVAFEDLAVSAYKEQLPKIQSDRLLAAAVAIHSVEARHASWIRRLAGILPASQPFDEPINDGQTVQIVNSTHFVTLQAPHTSAHRDPLFTG